MLAKCQAVLVRVSKNASKDYRAQYCTAVPSFTSGLEGLRALSLPLSLCLPAFLPPSPGVLSLPLCLSVPNDPYFLGNLCLPSSAFC